MRRSQLESMDLGTLRTIQAILLAIMPSALKTRIYKLFGAKIGKRVSIGFGTFILADSFSKIQIGDYSKVRQFTIIACSEVSIGPYTEIAVFVWIYGAGKLRIGDKCYIGPRCVINLRQNNFTMGTYAGLGGNVYTHGHWLPYTQGWPRSYGDVTIEDFGWVPAKVLLMPGVKVGTKSMVGSGAVVTKDIPPFSFAAGVPARVISPVKDMIQQIDEEELLRRITQIAEDIPNFFGFEIISNDQSSSGLVLTIKAHRKQWKIIVSKPQDIGDIASANAPQSIILLTSGQIPENVQKSKVMWFDLSNLQCGSIEDNFAFEIWDFLRRTWGVTCTVNDA